MLRSLLTPIATRLKSRFFNNVTKKIPSSIDEMDNAQIQLIKKYMLSPIEREKLKSQGLTKEEIDAADRKIIRISAMNDIDDDFGMSPLRREEIVDMASRKPSPKFLENYNKMQKNLEEADIEFKKVENYKPHST